VYLIIINDTYTIGATPLDEGSARRSGLYLKTNYIHERRKSVPLVGFEIVIPAMERLQTYALDRATTRIQSSSLVIFADEETKFYSLFTLNYASMHYFLNNSTLVTDILGHTGIIKPKKPSPDVRQIPPETSCIYTYTQVYEVCISLCLSLSRSQSLSLSQQWFPQNIPLFILFNRQD